MRDLAPRSAENPTWADVQAVLDEEIQGLPEPFRAAFVLCVLEGKSGPEAAAELGCKEGTVSSRLMRARQQLQQRLARRGIKLSALLAALALAESAGRASVPSLLARATVRSGLLAAAGQTAAGVIPSQVAALAAGVTKAMFLTKTKLATAALLALCLLIGAGFLAHRALAAKAPEGQQKEADKPPAKGAESPAPKEGAKPQAANEPADTVELAGRVVGPDGKPVAGATVHYMRRQYPDDDDFGSGSTGITRTHQETTTDADGRFRLRIPMARPPGGDKERSWDHTALTVTAKGYGPGWVFVSKAERVQDLTLKLVEDDVPINGRVLDLEGKPVAGVTVRVLMCRVPAAENFAAWLERLRSRKEGLRGLYSYVALEAAVRGMKPVVTGADGRFRITGLGRDRVAKLRFEGPTIETHDVYALTREEATIRMPPDKDWPYGAQVVIHGATFDHAAAPTKPVVGTVRDRDTGKPLAGVTVRGRLRPRWDRGARMRSAPSRTRRGAFGWSACRGVRSSRSRPTRRPGSSICRRARRSAAVLAWTRSRWTSA
jgi:protocatechuate 3,4-dioxygenase beta subunit